ncbi:hypothetical protein [Saccharothrix violaceirubra]|uniref:Uncharacterized protein n=1 Tax=Saccharothrix violaceirubra TaxID=413306 RepID=A0A7W7T1B0_9PSEU|nr:hypothetical protein [Saccharothrix violaceirubra]MBB4964738.1 hypothetical protein [Saccharothrix violaceirubra]
MTGSPREPTLDELIDDEDAKIAALGEADGVRPALDPEDPLEEEYGHRPVDGD